MKTGVSYASITDQATWSAVRMGGDYPPANLGDLVDILNVGRAESIGQEILTFTLPAAAIMKIVAFINHNIPAGVDVRVSLWSDLSNTAFGGSPGTNVYDSGLVDCWPTSGPAGGENIRPFILPEATSVRSGRIQIDSTGGLLEMGAIELANFWQWPGISPGFELSIDQQPFVFLYDADDAATWTRKAMLARNVDVPPLVGAMYRHDRFLFRFREHLR
jgi:hypothetical protein